ncbi:MAG: ABC transporter substrate-binding protein [Defluviitaleaceae bacterium]|nr:ABC transporter substrate-binding protein [Defluviitaleaceae bacterium]MCL2240275.1 ABC transporter substrate-binding protein [Defluviitaleaceae bacterium]
MNAFARNIVKIVMVLAVFAVLFAVTGCRGGDDPSPAPPPATPAPVTPGVTPAPAVPAPPVAHDGPPRVIRVTSWYVPNFHGSLYHMEEPDPDEVSDFEIAMMQYENMRAVEERFNVRFEPISTMEYEDHFDAFLSGQFGNAPIGDIVELSPGMMGRAYMGGHIIDLGTLNVPGSDVQGPNVWSRPGFEFGGGIWSLQNHAPRVQSFYIAYNIELGTRLGIADPVALYHAGGWTWDAMLEMMRTAAGQGYFGVSGVPRDVLQLIVASNNGMLATDDYQFAFDHPRTMQALEFFAQLYEERLFWYDREGNVSLYDWWGNITAFDQGGVLFPVMEKWVPGMTVGDAFEYRVLPFPQGPQGVGYAGLIGFAGGWVIPAGTEDPELILQVMEALQAWPGDDLFLVTEGALTWPRNYLFTEDCVRMVVEIADRRLKFDPGFAADLEDIAAEVGFDIFDGVRTVAEAVAYRRGPAQDQLNAFFGRG